MQSDILGVDQNYPNYQRQIAGPQPGQGMAPGFRGQRSRDRFCAPMAARNIPSRQHVRAMYYPSSNSGPGGTEYNTPEPVMSPLGILARALFIPRNRGVLPWLTRRAPGRIRDEA